MPPLEDSGGAIRRTTLSREIGPPLNNDVALLLRTNVPHAAIGRDPQTSLRLQQALVISNPQRESSSECSINHQM